VVASSKISVTGEYSPLVSRYEFGALYPKGDEKKARMFVMLTHHRSLRESRDLRRMHDPCLLRSQKNSDDGLVATMYVVMQVAGWFAL
jgi:hypothetical protein